MKEIMRRCSIQRSFHVQFSSPSSDIAKQTKKHKTLLFFLARSDLVSGANVIIHPIAWSLCPSSSQSVAGFVHAGWVCIMYVCVLSREREEDFENAFPKEEQGYRWLSTWRQLFFFFSSPSLTVSLHHTHMLDKEKEHGLSTCSTLSP